MACASTRSPACQCRSMARSANATSKKPAISRIVMGNPDMGAPDRGSATTAFTTDRSPVRDCGHIREIRGDRHACS